MNYKTLSQKEIADLENISIEELKKMTEKTVFTWSQIPFVISVLNKKNIAILGRDVLCKNNDSFDYTNENWFVNKAITEGYDSFKQRSYKETLSFLIFYDDNKLYFNLVIGK